MNKRYVPTYLAESIYEIDPSFYQRLGIKVILSDLDNTLASYKEKDALEKTKALIARLQSSGIRFYIASNNTSARVRRFAKELSIEALSGLAKPFPWKLRRLLKKRGFKKEETLLIGDQILTDVIAANGAGIRSVLTQPIAPIDPPWTRLNRFLEKRKRARIIEERLAKSWRECL